jgi:hypothetical protein
MSEIRKEIIFKDNTNIENVFTDIIELSINNETVHLKIGLKNKDQKTAKATHNIILTLPHFLRLAHIIKSSSEQIINQIEILTQDDNNAKHIK